MSSKMCCVCHQNRGDLINLEFKDEAESILTKLKEFIDLTIMKKDPNIEYICYPCSLELDEAFNFTQNCKKSMSVHTIQKPDFKCGECFMKFKNLKDLDLHNTSHQSINVRDDDDDDPEDFSYAAGTANPSQISQKMPTTGYSNKFKIPLVSSAGQNEPTTSYICRICKQTFQKQCGLSMHAKWHNIKKEQFKCEHCSCVFLRKEQMNKHIRKAHL
ncbi:zinc finger protein 845-like [Contarinia nasturtii]|uniref:zinc finger protein 845-like n=1 Tax=Contarinia nasturtii TaxID=265458 RepID=UPI0012D3CAFC|nr:zinc finger protein 845-like [Contarinia nasturtii]